MYPAKRLYRIFVLFVLIFSFIGCGTQTDDNVIYHDRIPNITPDYAGVTIPPNIAPMNFSVREDGNFFRIDVEASNGTKLSVTSRNGKVRFPEREWKELLENSRGDEIEIRVFSSKRGEKVINGFSPFHMQVVNDPVDPYLVYRMIHPGFYSWYRMKIVQRNLESFREESLIENQLLDHNCINCHSFNQNDPGKLLVHIRGSRGGTYFIDGDEIKRTELKTEDMPAGATYPSWHPSGKYVAFSSNIVRQSFHAHPDKYIDVYDLTSSLILYDVENNEILHITDHEMAEYNHTFPCWSPDGRYLYFARTKRFDEEIDAENIRNIYYDLARIPFYPESRSFGEAEIVFNASEINKSASFPKISPDGQYMIFTLHDYGTFPVWYKEADLYLLDLQSMEYARMDINSDDTESYHGWSSNGKWIVFSSKRKDGLSARPYFAYFGAPGKTGKPFVLPQKDPDLYGKMLKSFNLPEFVTGKVTAGPRDFKRAAGEVSLAAGQEYQGYAPLE